MTGTASPTFRYDDIVTLLPDAASLTDRFMDASHPLLSVDLERLVTLSPFLREKLVRDAASAAVAEIDYPLKTRVKSVLIKGFHAAIVAAGAEWGTTNRQVVCVHYRHDVMGAIGRAVQMASEGTAITILPPV